MDVSVVIPARDAAGTLPTLLRALAAQETGAAWEAILVDDGSLDHSAAVAKEFCSHDSRFRIVEQQNQGLGPARNTGVRFAEGEYITFVDSDDLVTRHAKLVLDTRHRLDGPDVEHL